MITPSQRQILEAVLEALPEKKVGLPSRDGWSMQQVNAYNKALIEVRAIINEFLKPEEVENE